MRGGSKSEVSTSTRVGLWIALLLLICALTPVANAANPLKSGYDVTILPDFNAPADLPVPPQGSAAFGMNNSGDVVGWSYYSRTDPSISAFLYRNGQLTRLGQLNGRQNSWANAINDNGIVVGGSSGPSFSQEFPFVWQVAVMSDLLGGIPACQVPFSFNCWATAADINAGGDIVGIRMLNPDGASGCCTASAYLYSNGTFTDLSDSKSAATAINDRGEIVGSREGSPGGGFLYRHGQMNDLAALGCSGCAPNDISRNGKVVGTASLSNGDSHAFLWAKGVMRDLGTLGGSFTRSEATAVNRKGTTVVGNARTSAGDTHGWVYAHGEMVDLNALIGPSIGTVVDVQDVNDRGQIVGQIAVTNPALRRGTFAVLLTPRHH